METKAWLLAHPLYHSNYQRTYKRKTPKKKNKEADKLAFAKYKAKYPERIKARAKFNDMIRTGKIIRPTVCSKCNSTGKIEGDHHDYTKPLEVTWLCHPCHAEAYRKRYQQQKIDALLAEFEASKLLEVPNVI